MMSSFDTVVSVSQHIVHFLSAPYLVQLTKVIECFLFTRNDGNLQDFGDDGRR
jgi:hypothetical protein